MLIDWLITGQVLPTNPAAAVRGRNHVVKTGKTPVLEGAERRAARLHSGHCAARFARPGIDRHVEDLNRPYGLAWRDDGLLVADQDGIWRVPHIIGALRAGRPVPPQRGDQVPPDQRKPMPAPMGRRC